MMYSPSHAGAEQRGFTLLIAIILASVMLALSLSLVDISYKQTLLAISAKQSQYAFAAADSGLECALYYDQDSNQDVFNFTNPLTSFSITCGGLDTDVDYPATSGTRRATFSVPCPSGGTSASVTVVKSSNSSTLLYSAGYSSCSDSDPRRIERGLKASY